MIKDPQVRRERLAALEETIHNNMTTPGVDAVKEYCELQREELKDMLLSCDKNEVESLQGAAESYYTIIETIERLRMVDSGD